MIKYFFVRPFFLASGLYWLLFSPVMAIDWLHLQNLEREDAGYFKVWGFLQPHYQYTEDSKLRAGPFAGQAALFNQVQPTFDQSAEFQVRRAYFGIRGKLTPDGRINYFLLADAGRNILTKSTQHGLALTDASLTFSYIPGARIRVGQFKTPLGEEALQAIHLYNHIHFTRVTNNLLLERFYRGDGSDPRDPNRPESTLGAFRDIGVEVFDRFDFASWQHSYAVMVGNGNGINRLQGNGEQDYYVYWASEKVLGGQRIFAKGVKLYGWYWNGERELTRAGAGSYDRDRYGLGFTFKTRRWNIGGEWIKAEGMIPTGTDGGAVVGTPTRMGPFVATVNVAPEDEADGFYVDIGYRVLPRLELALRYDRLNNATNTDAQERRFETLTLGAQIFIKKFSRVLISYEFRQAEAPHLPNNSVANRILAGIEDRISAQLLWIW